VGDKSPRPDRGIAMFYKYWRDYIKFLDDLMHIPLDGLKQIQKGSFDLLGMLKKQLNAQNEALLECYKSKGGAAFTGMPYMNIMVLEGGKVLFGSMDTERMRELGNRVLDSYTGMTGFPIDVGRRIGELIPNPNAPHQSAEETAQRDTKPQAHT